MKPISKANWERTDVEPDPLHKLCERVRATEIVERYARSPLDVFKLPDKSYFFSLSGRCVIAYRVANNIAIALGDPVGPVAEIEPTVCQFLQMCRENRWGVAFYQTLPDFVPVYCRLRLKKLKIGDDALVDLQQFSLDGKSKRVLRSKVHQLEEMGIHVVEYQPPVPESIITQLKAVSDQWLEIPGRRERSFALGHFDPDYLRSTPVLAVVDTAGSMLAFINLISVNRSKITGDLMRRRTDERHHRRSSLPSRHTRVLRCGALVLSTLGIYGLISFISISRTREMGIRIALGATKANIGRLIGSEGLRLTLLGVVAGVLLSAAMGRLLSSLLFGVRSFDAETIALAVAVLGLASTIAALIPALRSTRVQPITALRAE